LYQKEELMAGTRLTALKRFATIKLPSASAASSSKHHYDFIDGLRGLAVLMVVWVHVSQHVGPERDLIGLTNIFSNAGSRGVQLFFLISAFTLYATSLRRFKEDKHPRLFFYIRRFFRIWPFWLLTVIAWTLLAHHTIVQALVSALFLFGFVRFDEHYDVVDGGWTLFVEETFYVFLPLIFKHINSLWRAIGFSFFLYVLSDIWVTQAPQWWLNLNNNNFFPLAPVAQWFAFGLGIILFFLFREERFKKYVIDNSAIGLVLDGIAVYGIWRFIPGDYRVATWGLALIFIASAHTGTFFGKLMRTRAMRLWGRLCYSMYLLQFLLLLLIEPLRAHLFRIANLDPHPRELRLILWYPVFLLALTACSYLAHICIERPSIALGKRLIAYIAGRRSAAAKETLTDTFEVL
jgi:peptidoglycan/LPS O-acetylase OafA/YrhL